MVVHELNRRRVNVSLATISGTCAAHRPTSHRVAPGRRCAMARYHRPSRTSVPRHIRIAFGSLRNHSCLPAVLGADACMECSANVQRTPYATEHRIDVRHRKSQTRHRGSRRPRRCQWQTGIAAKSIPNRSIGHGDGTAGATAEWHIFAR